MTDSTSKHRLPRLPAKVVSDAQFAKLCYTHRSSVSFSIHSPWYLVVCNDDEKVDELSHNYSVQCWAYDTDGQAFMMRRTEDFMFSVGEKYKGYLEFTSKTLLHLSEHLLDGERIVKTMFDRYCILDDRAEEAFQAQEARGKLHLSAV
jgi:hypothetical protein